ncbi:Cu(I)/Ag(I) efflux system membrane protein CusA [Enterobacter cloacae]|uniref:Cu(I)/Ag(I) efflux system membrane protein CusA n=1 Tax=Enterobacter cloacae TaxID=550 RepID=A0A377LZL4_ENTCL|nr:Cu(I)/Ag(I) efflux system membrane protein CusA [Enterobacter cloacae]
MIAWIIRRAVANRFLVMMGALFLSVWGTWTIINTPVDALPDLSDVQVIIKTSYPGQAPQIVENQVTYPLTTTMLSVPGAKTVRGFSQFGDSYVYVIFEDGPISTGPARAFWNISIRFREAACWCQFGNWARRYGRGLDL